MRFKNILKQLILLIPIYLIMNLTSVVYAQTTNRDAKADYFPFGPEYHSKDDTVYIFTWSQLTARTQRIFAQESAARMLEQLTGGNTFIFAGTSIINSKDLVESNLQILMPFLNNPKQLPINEGQLVEDNVGLIETFTANGQKLPVNTSELVKDGVSLTKPVTDNPKNVPLDEAQLAEETVGLIDPVIGEFVEDGIFSGEQLAGENGDPSKLLGGVDSAGFSPSGLVQSSLSQVGVGSASSVASTGVQAATTALGASSNALNSINTNPASNVVGNLFK